MRRAGYYDIDDILASQELVPVHFSTDAKDLGYLDDTNEDEDLKSGTKLELPLWLSSILAGTQFVQLEYPKHFQKRFITHILADPSVVNLREKSEFFYEFGLKFALLTRDPELLRALSLCLGARFEEIITKSPHWRSTDFDSFTEKLTSVEEKLFKSKYLASAGFRQWKLGDSSKITAAKSRKKQRTK